MHIYCFEDGTTQYHIDPPTPIDLQSIANGFLSVIYAGGHIQVVDADGSLEEMDECEIIDMGNGAFHSPT